MLVGSCLSVVLIFAWRLFFSRYAMQILGDARVLLVGTNPAVEAVGRYIDSHPLSGLRVAGYVQEEGAAGDRLSGIKNFGDTGSLREIIRAIKPDRIVVGTRRAATAEFSRLLEDLRYAGENIQEAAETHEKVCGRVWVRDIEPAELIYTSRFGAPTRHVVVQRFSNPLFGLLALIVCLPIMVLTWLILKLHSSGPVFQWQKRVGLDNTLFTQYRFRLPEGPAAKRSGALTAIRKFHLDGLPQLLNVARGEMVFVGPHPECPEFVEALSEVVPYYPQRHCVRPGMTGWAEIQDGPSVRDALATLEYDLYYIKYMSMSLDTLILFQTLQSMFRETPEE
jgi:lipopolysaccharide/colanic/teichoic acid biosynthesis glycosyltransferase